MDDAIPIAHLANAVLDVFGADVAIASPQDFSIVVTDAAGVTIEEADDVRVFYDARGYVCDFRPKSPGVAAAHLPAWPFAMDRTNTTGSIANQNRRASAASPPWG